jgi:hypothetical protein
MNLSEDLNSYLKKSTSTPSLSILSSKLKLPTFKTPFGSSRPEDEEPFIESQDIEHGERSGSSWLSFSGSGDKPAEKSWFPALSKKQRIFGFMTSLILGIICFGLASAYIPFIVLKARKFSLLFSLGSLFTIASFSFLYGPWNHVRHLFSKERLPFTLIYLTSLTGTLYFSMALQSTVLTCIAALAQIIALVWFIVSYVPGGQTGLKFFSKLCSGLCRSSVSSTLPL